MGGLIATVVSIAKIPIEAYAEWKKKKAKQAKIKKAKAEALKKEKLRWKKWRADRLKTGKENHAKNTAAIVEKAREDIAALEENPY